jgi:hypothetical protein
MAIHIRRREFIVTLGSVAEWPLAAPAQQSTIPAIGFLSIMFPREQPHWLAAFREGLSKTGSEGIQCQPR